MLNVLVHQNDEIDMITIESAITPPVPKCFFKKGVMIPYINNAQRYHKEYIAGNILIISFHEAS